jgi:hypothetical protein
MRPWMIPELETLVFMAIASAVNRFLTAYSGEKITIDVQALVGFIQDTYCDFQTSVLIKMIRSYVQHTQARGLEIELVAEGDQNEMIHLVRPSNLAVLMICAEGHSIRCVSEVLQRYYGKQVAHSSVAKLFIDFAVMWEKEAGEPLAVSIENWDTPDILQDKWDEGRRRAEKKRLR